MLNKCARTACNNAHDNLKHRDSHIMPGFYCRKCALRINRANNIELFKWSEIRNIKK
jgi:hypothetical protein